MLYPCANNRDSLQQQMVNDNRLLWATLTPHGTRHFVSDFPSGQDGHYEVVDYKMKAHTTGREYKRTPVKVGWILLIFKISVSVFVRVLYVSLKKY